MELIVDRISGKIPVKPALIYIFFLANVLILVWVYRFLPLQDYPDWLFQGHVFTGLLKGDNNSAYNFIHAPVPNSISTILIGSLNFIFPPEISGKIVLSLCVFMYIAGFFFLLSAIKGDLTNPLCFVFILFLLNQSFFHGFTNFLFSLGILFFGIGYCMRPVRLSLPVELVIIMILSLLIYFSHAVTYGIWFIFIIIHAVFHFKSRGIPLSFGFVRYTKRECEITPYYIRSYKPIIIGYTDNIEYCRYIRLTALIPSFVLLIIYGYYRINQKLSVQFLYDTIPKFIKSKIYTVIESISVFHRFYPFFPEQNSVAMLVCVILNIACMIFVLCLCIIGLKKIIGGDLFSALEKSNEIPLIITGLIIFIFFIISPRFFAGIYNPGQRFLFIAVMIFLSLAVKHIRIKNINIRAIVKYGIVILAIVQFFYFHFIFSTLSGKFQKTYEQLEQVISENKEINDYVVIHDYQFDFGTGTGFKPKKEPLLLKLIAPHSPLVKFPFYLGIKYNLDTLIFDTGIIAAKKNFFPINSFKDISDMLVQSSPSCVILFGNFPKIQFISEAIKGYYPVSPGNENMIIMMGTLKTPF